MAYEMYVRIAGEPFLSRVRKYRDAMIACAAAWRTFAQAKGAISVPGGLTGLIFSGKAPDGWKRLNRKGWSQPAKGHPDEAVIHALPKEPSRYAVFGDALCFDLNYQGPGEERGCGGIGNFFFFNPSFEVSLTNESINLLLSHLVVVTSLNKPWSDSVHLDIWRNHFS